MRTEPGKIYGSVAKFWHKRSLSTSPPSLASSGLIFEFFTEDCDGLRERTCTDAESSLDDARFAADVLREVEDCRLPLAKRTHYLKPHDGRICGFQRFKTPHWTDQLLQLAM